MGELLIFYVCITILSMVLVGSTLLAKTNKSLLINVVISSVLSGIFGYLKYDALPTNFTGERIFAIVCAMMCIIPLILNALDKNKVKPIVVKISSVAILVFNLVLLIIL